MVDNREVAEVTKITIDNYLAIAALIFALFGGVFGLIQWTISNKIKRSEFIDRIIEKLRFDKEMAHTMYMIDYNQNWYNSDFHNSQASHELEFEIDKMLSYLSYICYLFETKNIKKKENDFLKYELIRACKNWGVQEYLWNLHHFSKKNGTDSSFYQLVNFGIKNKLFNKEFISANSRVYKQYLNF